MAAVGLDKKNLHRKFMPQCSGGMDRIMKNLMNSTHEDRRGIEKKAKFSIRTIAFSGVFSALIFLATFFLQLQTAGTGYVNLGDGVILAAAQLLGPVAFFPAAIGSALADMAGGYTIYIPGTFVIKGLMGFVSGLLMKKKDLSFSRFLFACLVGETIMVLGYFVYKGLVFNTWGAALMDIPHDIGQGVAGVLLAILFKPTVEKLRKE